LHVKAKHIILASLLVVLCFVALDFLFWSGRFPPNCYIEKIDVSSLSRYEALNKLKSANIDDVVLSPIFLYLEEETLSFRPSELGVYISPRRTVKKADKVAFRSNYLADLFKRIFGNYEQIVVPLSMDINEEIFNVIMEGLANSTNTPSVDAVFALTEGGRYRITKEKIGKRLDIARSRYNLKTALDLNKRSAMIEVAALTPRVYAKDLVKYPPKYLLSEYTTYYGSHDSPNRVHNIKLSSSRTNNYVMVSGEVFSLLDALGDFNRSSGYKEAFVLYNGELEPQYGGGSCQIASTFYNAALLAGLEIIERYNHGIYFTIYPLGRDASIYTGFRDLKIKNNTGHPVYIKAYATDKRLTYGIYGTPTAKKISFSRPMIFFEGEKYVPYDVMTAEAIAKINEALISGKPFYSYVTVTTQHAGYTTEKVIYSHYKLTGDRENVKIVRPEPQ